MSPKSIVIGATGGLGRAVSEQLALAGHEVLLVGTDKKDLDPMCRDLCLRHGIQAGFLAMDLTLADPLEFRRMALAELGEVDNLFLLAGRYSDEDSGEVNDALALELLQVNLTAPLRLANALLGDLRRSESGNLVGAGSVAAMRGRSRSLVYGAAKRGLEFYFQGLHHHLAGSGCRVQFYRLGFMRTQMTAGKRLPLPAADPGDVARGIVANLNRDLELAYLPRWWRVVDVVYSRLPWCLFKRLKA